MPKIENTAPQLCSLLGRPPLVLRGAELQHRPRSPEPLGASEVPVVLGPNEEADLRGLLTLAAVRLIGVPVSAHVR